MTPATRVALAAACAAASAVLLVTAFSGHWFHAPYDMPTITDLNWDGFGGPSDESVGLSPRDLLAIVAGLATMFAPLCALLVAFGVIAGRRRDHVPRLPALLAALFAPVAVLFQALAVATWPISRQPEPHGFGWAMPAFFVAGLLLVACVVPLWRDAARRARASAAALAKVDRELAARDLATLPESEPDEPPVERL